MKGMPFRPASGGVSFSRPSKWRVFFWVFFSKTTRGIFLHTPHWPRARRRASKTVSNPPDWARSKLEVQVFEVSVSSRVSTPEPPQSGESKNMVFHLVKTPAKKQNLSSSDRFPLKPARENNYYHCLQKKKKQTEVVGRNRVLAPVSNWVDYKQ